MPDPRMLVAALDNALNSLMRQVHRQATISFQEAAIEFQPSRRTTSGQAAITDDNIRLATLRRQNTPRQHVTAPRRQNAPIPVIGADLDRTRSEERRVGKEWVSTCRSRWSPEH